MTSVGAASALNFCSLPTIVICANGSNTMTEDERRIAGIEARVFLSMRDTDEGRISKDDFKTLLNSRLAWKYTAKCYAVADGQDANKEGQMNDPVPCIVCKKKLGPVGSEAGNHANDANSFRTSGQYGSTVFDPLDGTYLEVNICDECLTAAGEAGQVLIGFPQPAPPRGPLMQWPLTEVESESSVDR